jgi:hypothetical protein
MVLPLCATRHKLGIQTHKGREGRQIATLFERAAWFERSLDTAAVLVRMYQGIRCAWTKRSFGRDVAQFRFIER